MDSPTSDENLKASLRDGDRAVFLDFDGSLCNGNLSMNLMFHLIGSGFFTDGLVNYICDLVTKSARKEITLDYFYTEMAMSLVAGAFGKKAEELELAANEVFERFKPNIYESSYELIALSKNKGYWPIIVSGGIQEVNSLAAGVLGVDECYSSQLGIDGNRAYDGTIKMNLLLPQTKFAVIKKLGGRFDLGKSIGYGDSIKDKEWLEIVGIPIALNPDDELKMCAIEKGWRISNHRNVVCDTALLLAHESTKRIKTR